MTRFFSAPSFAAGIVIGVVIAGAWFVKDYFTLSAPLIDTGSTTSEFASSESGAVSVSDQPAGDAVAVESVTVPPPGVWVAVRELVGSDLGNVLGAQKANAPATDISVPLLRATQPGRTYAVELYRDDGNGAFDVGTDSVYVDFDTGERVVVYFKTTP